MAKAKNSPVGIGEYLYTSEMIVMGKGNTSRLQNQQKRKQNMLRLNMSSIAGGKIKRKIYHSKKHRTVI